MQTAHQLHAAGVPVFPCTADKAPAVPKGVHWLDVAQQPPQQLRWPSNLVGVPIPPGVLVIDLDTYKGVTREQVDQLLGCTLDWDRALIQTTLQGGHHYAFQAPGWPVRQGSNLGVQGFDTRVAGKGYIATGLPYYKPHGFGVFAFAAPASLPRLPDACRAVLEHVAPEQAPRELPTDAPDLAVITAALRHLDPGCGRSEWLKVGLALRHQFHADEEAGRQLFHAWSAGDFWEGDQPTNYDPDTTDGQFLSFKAEGATTVGTLFYMAAQAGWQPPAGVDTAAAFGAGAVPLEQFCGVVDELQQLGGDPRHTDRLVGQVVGFQGSELQRSTLMATLLRELKEAGLLTKGLRSKLDPGTTSTAPAAGGAGYGKNDTDNAQLFLQRNYPNGTLVQSEQCWYAYTGQGWVELQPEDVTAAIARDMAPARPMSSHISGTARVVGSYCLDNRRKINRTPPDLALFANGVLHLPSGQLSPHTPDLFTTNCRGYDYNPLARCDEWLAFLRQVFSGDAERVALLQEWMGYNLVRSYQHHKMMVMVGPTRCGKGTIGRVLQEVVGEANYSGGRLASLCRDPFLASLRTKQVVFIGDASKRIPKNQADQVIEMLKTITGGDAVSFERKFKDSLTEALPARITIASNHIPALFDDSGALANRILLLTFDQSFLNREDHLLAERLLAEVEGIAVWALAGWARLQQVGRFTSPAASAAELSYIKESYSPVRQFLDGCCQITPDHPGMASEDVYGAYRAWALRQDDGGQLMPRRVFVSGLKDLLRGTCAGYDKSRYGGHATPVWGFRHLAVTDVVSGSAGAFAPGLAVVKG